MAAKAGTCLEDGNSHDKTSNVFDNLGDAVAEVDIIVTIIIIVTMCCCV